MVPTSLGNKNPKWSLEDQTSEERKTLETIEDMKDRGCPDWTFTG